MTGENQRPVIIELTVIVRTAEDIARISEIVNRTATGLVLDGVPVHVEMSPAHDEETCTCDAPCGEETA